MLLVEPQELFGIESGGRLVDISDTESSNNFLAGKNLPNAVRLTQTHEVVEQRIWQIPLFLIL